MRENAQVSREPARWREHHFCHDQETLVSVTTRASLEEILSLLRTKHLAGNDLKLAPICTRVMLRTGVSLKSPRPEQERDPATIAKVLSCLSEMGYPL
jgi:hypothetical protein